MHYEQNIYLNKDEKWDKFLNSFQNNSFSLLKVGFYDYIYICMSKAKVRCSLIACV